MQTGYANPHVNTQGRPDMRSPLFKAIQAAAQGDPPNACPFGCEKEDLDEHGRCRHLVGFTVPGNDKLVEPITKDEKGRYRNGPPEAVKAGDQLVKITVSSRVYRDVDKPTKKPKQGE